MPAKTRASTLADVEALLPDNASGAITPAALRAVLRTLADSALFPEDGPFVSGGGDAGGGDPTPAPSDFSADFSADFGTA